jgi:chromosomal replication initiation ATPase DnaA
MLWRKFQNLLKKVLTAQQVLAWDRAPEEYVQKVYSLAMTYKFKTNILKNSYRREVNNILTTEKKKNVIHTMLQFAETRYWMESLQLTGCTINPWHKQKMLKT